MIRMFFRTAVVSLLLTVLLTGIAGSAAPTRLSLLHHMGNDNERFKAMLGGLESELNIDINMVTAGSKELVEKAFVMAAGDVLPDVIRIDQQQVRALTLAGLLDNLNGYISRDKLNLKRDFLPVAVESFAYEGGQYALPAENASNVLFFNKTYFNNAGLVHPTTNWKSDQWTWDDFSTAAKRLTIDTNGDGKTDQYGIANMGHFYFYPWLWGADWQTPDFSRFLGDSPEVISALEQMVAIKLELGAQGGSFSKGTAAMNINGNWELNGLRSSSLDWDMATWPKATYRTTIFYPNGFAISKASKNKDLAWKILTYLTIDAEGVRAYTDVVNRVPSHRLLWNYYLAIQEQYFKDKANQVFIDALSFGNIWHLRYATNWSHIDAAIQAEWDKAWKGQVSVAAAMRQAAQTVNTLMKDAMLVQR